MFYDKTEDIPHPFIYRVNDDKIICFKFKYRDALSTSSRAEYINLSFEVLNKESKCTFDGQDMIVDVWSSIVTPMSLVQKDSVVWEYGGFDCFLDKPNVPCKLNIPLHSIRGKVKEGCSVDRKPLKLKMYANDIEGKYKQFQVSLFGCSIYATPLSSKRQDDKIKALINLFSSDVKMPRTGLNLRYIKPGGDDSFYPISMVITL